MSIKATVNGTEYSGITTINAGGKAVSLAEVGTIVTPTATKSITANGTNIDVLNYAKVNVSVEGGSTPTYQEKTATANGTVTPDSGYDALSKVTVNVPSSGITPTGTKTITSNGTFDVTNFASALVNVPTSGGGLPAKMYSGTFTNNTGANITTTDSGIAVSMNLDAVPFAVFVYPTTTESPTSVATCGGSIVNVGVTSPIVSGINSTASGVYQAGTGASYVPIKNITKDGFDFVCYKSSSYPILAGAEFRWVAIVL